MGPATNVLFMCAAIISLQCLESEILRSSVGQTADSGSPSHEARPLVDAEQRQSVAPPGSNMPDDVNLKKRWDITDQERRGRLYREKRSDIDSKAWEEMVIKTAVYLQHHKFMDFDHRFQAENGGTKKKKEKAQLVFMKQFPLPPLRRLHVGLEARCTRSFHGCLQYLATVVSQTPHWRMVERDVRKSGLSRHAAANKFLRDSRKNKALLSRPFKSILEVFQFRTTASIYMCWYTLRRLAELERFDKRCDYWGQDDYRTHNKEPFQCALYSFCPDPCCGHAPDPLNVHAVDMCLTLRENPCYGVSGGHCSISPDNNRHIDGLINNKLNYTCQCSQQGFEWNAQFGLCVDKDECYDNNHACAKGEVCRNTVGSYTCRCQRGTHRANGTEGCVPISLRIGSALPREKEEPAPAMGAKAANMGDKTINDVLGWLGGGAQQCQRQWFVLLPLGVACILLA